MSEHERQAEIIAQGLGNVESELKRIADALEALVKFNTPFPVLKYGDTELKVDTKVYDDLEVTEEVIMDLTEVTIMVITGKAILAVKKGFQKWVPKSTIKEFDNLDISEGDFLKDIPLTEAAEKWLPEKLWEKYEVKKR